MRPQIDLNHGRVMLALGAAGLAGAGATAPMAAADAVVAPAPSGTTDGLQLDPSIFAGGALGPLRAPSRRVTISATTAPRNLLVGRRVSVTGVLRPDPAPAPVALQERGRRGWLTIARATTSRTGRYRLSFRPGLLGTLVLRVRFGATRTAAPASRGIGLVNVYRLAGASWYGGGGPLACGGTLTDSRLGVAHRTLPCGTLVRLHLGNRTVRVPVIDRGPYVAGRDYDLTPATRRALGFGDVGEIWATR
jgi:rare lipoprotein A